MTKDELDKYLAHLPARSTRRGGGTPPTTPPPATTSSDYKLQTKNDIYKQSTRSSFGVRGPRGPLSKATADPPQRKGTSGNFASGDGTSEVGGVNKHGPDSSTTNIDTTDTKLKYDSDITTLMKGMDLNESNNNSSFSATIPSQRTKGDDGYNDSTDTSRQTDYSAASNTGKYELEHSNSNNAYEYTPTSTYQPSSANRMASGPSTQQQQQQQQYQPNIDVMPPIPTFSFGNDDNSKDGDDGDDDKNILNLALGLRCGGCDKLISGMAITAAGHRWHADCFKCQHCHQDLEHVAFYEKDGLPYCALDYHELFTTRCQYCHTPIEEKSIHALGRYYHVGHFFCRECGKPFDEDSTFMEHDGHPYCEKDYLAKFAHKCKGCKEDITGDFLEALEGKWHITCFVCVDCGKAFESNTFYVRNDLPYCERHSRRIKKPT